MQFCDKLSFLMNITQITNKELAHVISVDSSLISLLKNGKRKMPKNLNYIKKMAYYFAKHIDAEFQRYALADMIGLNTLRSVLPTEVLTKYLYKWLTNDSDIVENIIEGLDSLPQTQEQLTLETISNSSHHIQFFYGEEGHRESILYTMNIMKSIQNPTSVLIVSDDDLKWLFDDFQYAKKIQSIFMKNLDKGFHLYQIMPPSHYLNSYVESLQYWLPIYVHDNTQVYYYPRMRDQLYHHEMIIIPDYCVQVSTGLGSKSQNQMTMVSTIPEVVQAYTKQYFDFLELCQPAIISHTNIVDFFPCFEEIFKRNNRVIQFLNQLSATTIPAQCYEKWLQDSPNDYWTQSFELYLNNIFRFEEKLKNYEYIDIACLASAKDIREGKVPIITPYAYTDEQITYTPETYIMHLENIIYLMQQYENYYFIPLEQPSENNYNLIVNEDGIALLIRLSSPALMLEIHRPEIVQGCSEHLLRMAEKVGYQGIHKTKIINQLKSLIRELK